MSGHSMDEFLALWKAGRPLASLRFRAATHDLLSEAAKLFGSDTLSLTSPDKVQALEQAVQRRMRDEPPSIYLFWQERLDIIDTRFCGLPALPDGPESALNLVHLCAPGELN